MFSLLGALYAFVAILFIGCAQQYPIQAQPPPCVNNCVQNCMQSEAQPCDQYCQQSCEQLTGKSSYEPIVWNNHPIYLRPGLLQQTPNTPLIGNIPNRPAQSQHSLQSMESVSGTVTSTDITCKQICMPSCTPQCIHQEPIASHVTKGPIPIIGEQFAPVISQRPGPMTSQVSQEPVPVIPSQGVIGGPGSVIAGGSRPVVSQEPDPMLRQRSNSVTPSQGVQKLPQFPLFSPQATECVPACVSTCSIQCTQQNLITSRLVESPTYSTPAATYISMSGSRTATLQQPTSDCVAACIPLCNAECTHDQPQPLSVAPEPVAVHLQPTPGPDQFPSLVPPQSSTTECLPSTIETECACPRGFTVCVTASGSNQCCRTR